MRYGFLCADALCARVMLRRLLACIALLTGLAAVGAPAQAHMAESDMARIEAGLAEAGASDDAIRPLGPRPERITHAMAWAEIPATRAFALRHPSVRVGIDRARE